MPAGIWGRAKLVFISIMVDTTEYRTLSLRPTPFYGKENLKLWELLYIKVLRSSQRGNQVEKVAENALRQWKLS